MLVAKYQLNDSTSVIGGIKHVSVSGGELSLPAELGANDPYGDDREMGSARLIQRQHGALVANRQWAP